MDAQTEALRAKFGKLGRDPYLAAIVGEVRELWDREGCPVPPEGPSCETFPPCCEARAEDIGDWGGAEEMACKRFNALRESLGGLVAINGIGRHATGIYIDGTPEWETYRADAIALLVEWDCDGALNLFCDLFGTEAWGQEVEA